MILLAPAALLLGLVAVPIVLMYVLKLRREDRSVASTFLWRRVVHDVQANAPWQRLRPSRLLLLQLLCVAALVLALARPAYTESRTYSGDVIVLVDQSFGMTAHDVHPNRFAAALDRVRGLARSLGSGRVMSVIGMGPQPHLVIGASDDPAAVDRAAATLRPGVGAPNLLGALSLARSLARTGQNTDIVILTSRDSGISRLPVDLPFPAQIVRIGHATRDLAIVAFRAARVGRGVEAVARLRNVGPVAERSDLDLSVDGRLADVRPISLAPGATQNVFWTALPADASVLRAHLTVRDDVDLDKSAQAVLPRPERRHILLVSSGDFFLQTALALDPSIVLSTVRPGGYRAGLASRYDAVIFEGYLPPHLPSRPSLVLGPPAGSLAGMRFGSMERAGAVRPTLAGTSGPLASLLSYVDTGDIQPLGVRRIAGSDLEAIVETKGYAVISAGDVGSSRMVVVAFDPRRSDWPLRVSYPIALHNLLRYLAPGSLLSTHTINAGGTVSFQPGPGVSQIVVRSPSGAATRIGPPFPPFAATQSPGIYTARSVGESGSDEPFAVNAFPSRPAPAGGPATLNVGSLATGAGVHAEQVPVAVAWVLGLAALLLLSGEWWFALRR